MSEPVSLSRNPAPQAQQDAPVPADLVPLPSKGKIYPPESPLHMVETVEIRSMTARDEDILTSRALLKSGKAISTLIRSCLTNKAVDPDGMIVGDRNAVLIAVRITGYGAEYEVTVECPLCEEKSPHTFDLARLPIKPLGVEPIEIGQNLFSFVMPSKKEVKFCLMTGGAEREMSVALERMRKAVGPGADESLVTSRLIQQVVSLGGEDDRQKLAGMIRNMSARDSRALRMYIDKISPGVDMTQEFSCARCGGDSEVDVPMGTEFFWPRA